MNFFLICSPFLVAKSVVKLMGSKNEMFKKDPLLIDLTIDSRIVSPGAEILCKALLF